MNLKTVSISNTSEFRNLLNNSNKKEEVKELIVNENCCNDMNDDLEISGFENLEKIIVKRWALQKLNSLKICNCEKLKIIETEGANINGSSFFKVKKENIFCFLLAIMQAQCLTSRVFSSSR